MNGGVFKIEQQGEVYKITDGRNRTSNIVSTDSLALNGVLHVVDRVLLPSVSAIQAQAEKAGLSLTPALSFGPSYAATLIEWCRRFLHAWPQIARLGDDSEFKRLWEYYLCDCEAGFRSGRVDVGLFTLRHADGPGRVEGPPPLDNR